MKKKSFIIAMSLGLIGFSLSACQPDNSEPEDNKPTTEDPVDVVDDTIDWDLEKLGDPMLDPIDNNNRVFYQIFPISFSDANGDGKGDIRGIINRLDYLNDGDIHSGKSLGVQGLWLTPIMPSPSYHKYDVINYRSIDSTFGTMADYEELLEKCHQRNIKVIMDLVINHSSNQNQWFTQFVQAHKNEDTENKYYDWYTWYPYKKIEHGEEVSGIPSGHTVYNISGTTHYYEGNFSSDMPELNFDNEEVYQEFIDIAKFWIDKGVDGFRFDAAKYIYYGAESSNIVFWRKYVNELNTYTKENYDKDLYTVGEVWSADSDIISYHSAVNAFNFGGAAEGGAIAQCAKGQMSASTYINYVMNFVDAIKQENENAIYMPFLSNHDMNRSAGYFSSSVEDLKMAANLYILGPGSPFIYYGEEIGMKGSRGGAQTDANRRLKMRWGNYEIVDNVRDPLGATYNEDLQVNGTVESQINSKSSILTHYRHLIQIRINNPILSQGVYEKAVMGGKTCFKVTLNDKSVLIFHNNEEKDITIDLSSTPYTKILASIGSKDAKMESGKITLGAKTSVVVE